MFVQRPPFHFSPNSMSGPCQGLGSGLSHASPGPTVRSALEAGPQLSGLQASGTPRLPISTGRALSLHPPHSTLGLGTRSRMSLDILGPSASPVCDLPVACPPLYPLPEHLCFGDAHPLSQVPVPTAVQLFPGDPKPGPSCPCRGGQCLCVQHPTPVGPLFHISTPWEPSANTPVTRME